MEGFSCLGVDWLDIAKGMGGMLQGAGQLGKPQQQPYQPPPPPPKSSIGAGTILLGIAAATVGAAIIVGVAKR